uniref:Uncharacterized protein n=1 Tax=Noctiluca scintillans TaxID=2966 RepID=A0A7S1FH59_NOCSC|mmetsp:Transcript_64039/g.169623  ORF Transcript_64039/g.169623 Transcript_64039/m.169623 type:complete len:477 (+) Transcript_64039:109-1539(+)
MRPGSGGSGAAGSAGIARDDEREPASGSSSHMWLTHFAEKGESPSDGQSETFSSWHDDASSSLATCSAGDRTVTVNMQRMRMGEHLRGKLEGMIHQRFDNYLEIRQVLQNNTGKLAALECELAVGRADGRCGSGGISISCNEDGTFLVYALPDAAAASAEPMCAAVPSSSCAQEDSFSQDTSVAATLGSPLAHSGDFLPSAHWIEQVREFGMSGRCHSLTALFQFGHNVWKQLLRDSHIHLNGQIAEEDERQRNELREVREERVSVTEELQETRSLSSLLMAAQVALDLEQLQQALDLCAEGIAQARECDAWGTDSVIQQMLLLRASANTRLGSFDAALQDAEELIQVQPTCAEAYYWQSMAMQGAGLGQEALESVVSALEYDPQNCLFQQAFTALFDEVASATRADRRPASEAVLPRRARDSHGLDQNSRRLRIGGAHPGDALSTTTQATHLSSRSTTPTEVSAAVSRSSSNDSG